MVKGDKFLTIKQVCERWGISRWTLRQQMKDGTVRVRPCGYVGKRIRWRESDLDRDMATSSVANDFRRFILRS